MNSNDYIPGILITGANRGLGLELSKQYAEAGWRVMATCRNPDKADDLSGLASQHEETVSVHKLDIDQQDQIDALAKELKDVPIDILFNNAGIIDNYGVGTKEGKDDPDLANYDHDFWAKILDTNVVSQGRVTGALVPNVRLSQKKLVVFMSSGLGSIENTDQAGRYAYRTSKAAVNMLAKCVSIWLEPEGICCIAMAPGWTQTELGGQMAPVKVPDSVAGMRKIMDGMSMEKTGTYWNFDGKELPW